MRLEYDQTRKDRYGRTLAYVYHPDPSQGRQRITRVPQVPENPVPGRMFPVQLNGLEGLAYRLVMVYYRVHDDYRGRGKTRTRKRRGGS